MFFPYPKKCPDLPLDLGPEWFSRPHYDQWLRRLFPLHLIDTRVGFDILELGSFLGRSSLAFLEIFPRSRVTCVDIWSQFPHLQSVGQAQNYQIEKYPDPRSQFIRNTFDSRSRIRPINLPSYQGIEFLYQSTDYEPDIVYHDGDHSSLMVERDVLLCAKLWPKARQFGDDWETWPTVLIGAKNAGNNLGRRIEIAGPFWVLGEKI